jgi:alanine or glycine:cation symporter, AGCS family
MVQQIFFYLSSLEDALWSYVCIPLMMFLGIFLSVKFNFVQLFKFNKILKTFLKTLREPKNNNQGTSPIGAFFASIGGCIGIGNIVAVCTAVQLGGPGAIFWMWVAAFFGMIIKYSEVYLGSIYRKPNSFGGYDGGPMYFLQKIVKTSFIPVLVAILLCIYGTEVYMFKIITHSVIENWGVNQYLVIFILLILIVYAGAGGVDRVGKIAGIIIPFFLFLFVGMSSFILLKNISVLPNVIMTIFTSAFTGHAAIGGFAGSTMLLAMSQGVARGCYTGDIGVGYASIVQAESSCLDPKKQAKLAILGIFIDTFIVCTTSTFLITATGIWNENISPSLMVQKALSTYFPYMHIYMPIFLFILGYSSLIAFFCVGLKCARFIDEKKGPLFYYVYSILSFILFSFIDQKYALSVMSITGALLLIINIVGMYKLHQEVEVF